MKLNNYIKCDFNLEWLKEPELKSVWKALSSCGAKVYLVGGCVRNTILGEEVKDIDIATDMIPDEVIRLSKSKSLKVIPTGISHGTVMVLSGGKSFDVTTFRSDLETDGRHAKVRFSTSIEEDARRRDFTMNALYMTIDGDIIDPLCGWKDLVNGRVKFIGNPVDRINEDYLRILRYFRFLALYTKTQDNLDITAVAACSSAAYDLKKLSKERIWIEIQKLLTAKRPIFALEAMYSSGVLREVLPFSNIKKLENFLMFEIKFNLDCNEINRLIALSYFNNGNWTNDLPLSKKQRNWIILVLLISKDSYSSRVKGFKYGKFATLSALAIFGKNLSQRLEKDSLIEIKLGASKEFPLKTADFLKYFKPSKELGEEVKRLKDIWFKSNLGIKRKELLIELKTYNRSQNFK